MRWLACGIILSVILAGCKNEDKPSGTGSGIESYFFDYVIRGEQGGLVTVKLQFHDRGAPGGAVSIAPPGGVLLDGHPVPGDSTAMSGVYYDTSFYSDEFHGTHAIEIKDASGKVYREEINYQPLALADSFPAVVKRSEWVIRLQNLPPENARMRVVLSDTSFTSSWINQRVPIENGSIRITEAMWSRLKSGPIFMELHLESVRRLKERTRAGGRISQTYSLKRELILED